MQFNSCIKCHWRRLQSRDWECGLIICYNNLPYRAVSCLRLVEDRRQCLCFFGEDGGGCGCSPASVFLSLLQGRGKPQTPGRSDDFSSCFLLCCSVPRADSAACLRISDSFACLLKLNPASLVAPVSPVCCCCKLAK